MTFPTPTPRRAELDLTPVLLAAALALGVVAQVALPQVAVRPSASAPFGASSEGRAAVHAGAASSIAAQPQPAAIPDYPSITGHPLFNAGRSQAADAGEATAPVGAFSLLGVASAGARASAILLAPGGAIRTLAAGESLDGWRLVRVGGDTALLARGEVMQSLRVGAPAAAARVPEQPTVGLPVPVQPVAGQAGGHSGDIGRTTR